MSDQIASIYSRASATFWRIYGNPLYIAVNVAAIIIYYFVFVYLIKVQEGGVFIATVPPYLVYLLVISSSIALTIGIYSVRNTRNNAAEGVSTGAGTATALVGGVIAGCGCTEPIILSLGVFGLSTSQTFALLNFVSGSQGAILWVMIVINSFVVLYYLNKLSKPACELRKK